MLVASLVGSQLISGVMPKRNIDDKLHPAGMKIHAKWGFGNAPLKKKHRETTEKAIAQLRSILANLPENPDPDQLESISHVKGQFTRVLKQDQWDWSTVWLLLGKPSRQPANKISKTLGHLRKALVSGDYQYAKKLRGELQHTELERYLDNYMSGNRDSTDKQGTFGYIYVLSTRTHPNFLKIGMTQRYVEARVKEINSATGVVVPFGIRAVWKALNAPKAEKEIHQVLAEYRIRDDREFFEIEFNKASRIINDYFGEKRMLKK